MAVEISDVVASTTDAVDPATEETLASSEEKADTLASTVGAVDPATEDTLAGTTVDPATEEADTADAVDPGAEASEEKADTMASTTDAVSVVDPATEEAATMADTAGALDPATEASEEKADTMADTADALDPATEAPEEKADTMASTAGALSVVDLETLASEKKAGDVMAVTVDAVSVVDPATGEPALQTITSASLLTTDPPYHSPCSADLDPQCNSPPSPDSQALESDSKHRQAVTVDSKCSTAPLTRVGKSIEKGSAIPASNYASSGPQDDLEMSPRLDETSLPSAPTAIVPELAMLGDVTQSVGELSLEAGMISNANDTQTSAMEESPMHSPEVTVGSQPSSETQLNCGKDSILFSLKRFFSLEYLSGDNQFACVDCTKKLAVKAGRHGKMMYEEGIARDMPETGKGEKGVSEAEGEGSGSGEEERHHCKAEEGGEMGRSEGGEAGICWDGREESEAGETGRYGGGREEREDGEDGETGRCGDAGGERLAGEDGNEDDGETGKAEDEEMKRCGEGEGSNCEESSSSEGEAIFQRSHEQNPAAYKGT